MKGPELLLSNCWSTLALLLRGASGRVLKVCAIVLLLQCPFLPNSVDYVWSRRFLLRTHNSSLEDAMKLKCAPFCSS